MADNMFTKAFRRRTKSETEMSRMQLEREYAIVKVEKERRDIDALLDTLSGARKGTDRNAGN